MSQSLAKILIHIIFSTKNRYPFLVDEQIIKEMHSYLAKIFNEFNSHALIVGGTEDHVHILCSLSKTETLAKIIGGSKRSSSLWVKSKGGLLEKFKWQNGYGAFSISMSHMERIRNYIANQKDHHKKTSFKDEFREFLEKNKINYDEKYIWD
jgi:REP element-mobilizing transposase RayT